MVDAEYIRKALACAELLPPPGNVEVTKICKSWLELHAQLEKPEELDDRIDHAGGCSVKTHGEKKWVSEITVRICAVCNRIEHYGHTYVRMDEADAVVLDASLHGIRPADICAVCGEAISPPHAAVDGEGNPVHALCIGKKPG